MAPEYETQYFAGLRAESLTQEDTVHIRSQGVTGSSGKGLPSLVSGRNIKRTQNGTSSGTTVFFVLHPFANKIRAVDNTKIATFPSGEIRERNAV